MRYDFQATEKKWQEKWREIGAFDTREIGEGGKFYALIEFPYPSGEGLHVGHTRPYTALDILARKRRREGENVLFPMGWDAFGLPTENYAIANKIHPALVTKRNIEKFKGQLNSLGYSFDWSKEVNTTDPGYYKWTQWIFLQMFKKGLAYKKKMPVNWCTSCRCVLANEEVVDGGCERCGAQVVRREKEQWMLKITAYAEKLLLGLELVDYPERVKAQQRNWIGRSEGADVDFRTSPGDVLKIFTTRPDTLFGATYMVMSPEHPLLDQWKPEIKNFGEVESYRLEAAKKSDFERSEMQKDKTGVRLEGVTATNPVNGSEIPIYVSDYVLMSYGTGAIMAVPGHDTRDYEFAKTFNLPIVEVVGGGDISREAYTDTARGKMVNSGFLDGLEVSDAIERITEWLVERGLGKREINYKLRDWVFSRQRYWGEPIPIVKCEKCGLVPLDEKDLPLLLPEVESYEPTDSGESPLSKIRSFVETTCPLCKGPAERETDTMPQWAGSSWYFLRYADPKNDEAIAGKEALEYFTPVDWYNGGMEHTTLHLLYSRFWHKFLYDIGVTPSREPYMKRTSHGMILGEDGQKMSKSRGNVVDPMSVVKQYGADTMRLYIMFMGDFEKSALWSSSAVKGCYRFIERICKFSEKPMREGGISAENENAIHKAIKKVTGDIEELKFNTAIACLMSLLNDFYDKGATAGDFRMFLQLLNPFAPHVADELWERHGNKGVLSVLPWPEYDEQKIRDANVTIAVQVNGKLRSTITIEADAPDDALKEAAVSDEKVRKFIADGSIVKTIVVKNKLINLIVKTNLP